MSELPGIDTAPDGTTAESLTARDLWTGATLLTVPKGSTSFDMDVAPTGTAFITLTPIHRF